MASDLLLSITATRLCRSDRGCVATPGLQNLDSTSLTKGLKSLKRALLALQQASFLRRQLQRPTRCRKKLETESARIASRTGIPFVSRCVGRRVRKTQPRCLAITCARSRRVWIVHSDKRSISPIDTGFMAILNAIHNIRFEIPRRYCLLLSGRLS